MDALIVVYCLVAALVGVYGLNCHHSTWQYRRRAAALRADNLRLLGEYYGAGPDGLPDYAPSPRLPVVTTQVPIYNELAVAERVVRAVAALRYPAGRHEIQVLDDSTDETRQVVARTVESLRAQGVDIHHVTRPDRAGYKAGALRHGLALARGEVVAIFDADFVPEPDFLLKTVPLFQDPAVGFVQGRWEHLNREETLLTRLIATGIDGHFVVEQNARCAAGFFMNFNGTAGLFRKAAVLQAGNWQDDTLTEDLDLSYRIQLAGYRPRYVDMATAPAEVPADINAFKGQQFRWAKGSIQTAMKLMPRVFASGASPLAKLLALLHMTHYLVHPLMTFLAVSALPIIWARGARPGDEAYLVMGLFLLASSTGPSVMYMAAQKGLGRNPWRVVPLLPCMVVLGCGLTLNNTRAVAEALLGRTSPFLRTPKRGGAAQASTLWQRYRPAADPILLAELAAAAWCAMAMAAYWGSRHWVVGHFMGVYTLGFATVAVLSWKHGRR